MSDLEANDPTTRALYTAAQRALGISELLSLMLQYLSDCPRSLAKCARVDSFWFAHAIKLLWRKPPDENTHVFLKLEPPRKQMYLSHVQKTRFFVGKASYIYTRSYIAGARDSTELSCDAVIEYMRLLPMLWSLSLYLDSQAGLQRLAAGIDEHSKLDFLCLFMEPPGSLWNLADIVMLVRRLPNLRVLKLPYMAPTSTATARMLTEALPKLECFKYEASIPSNIRVFTGPTTQALLEGFAANAPGLKTFRCRYGGNRARRDGINLRQLAAGNVVLPALERLYVRVLQDMSVVEVGKLLRQIGPNLRWHQGVELVSSTFR